MSNTNWSNAGHFYAPQVKPVLLNCSFIVDSTTGLGIRSLTGPKIKAVYMHTSTTPAAGNPNPANGNIIVQMTGNHNRYLGAFAQISAPNSGSALTATTVNGTYVITALGTATLAQWQAKGLPVGVTPAVGVAFVATATGTIGGSAAVQIPLSTGSGIDHIEVVGNPQTTISAIAPSGVVGARIIMQSFLANVLTQPADGTLISLSIYLSDSNVKTAGQ